MKNIKEFILESNDVIKQFYNSHKDICHKPEYNGTGRIVISIHDKNILANIQKLDNSALLDIINPIVQTFNYSSKIEKNKNIDSKDTINIYSNNKVVGSLYLRGLDREYSFDFRIDINDASCEKDIENIGVEFLNKICNK